MHDAAIKQSLEPLFTELRKRRRLVGGMSWRDRREACFRVRATDDPPSANDIVREAVQGVRQSGVIERCQQRFRDEGTLETRINIVSDEGDLEDAPLGISVRIGGKLAGTALGNCMAAEVTRAVENVRLPAGYESGVVFARFPQKGP